MEQIIGRDRGKVRLPLDREVRELMEIIDIMEIVDIILENSLFKIKIKTNILCSMERNVYQFVIQYYDNIIHCSWFIKDIRSSPIIRSGKNTL